VFLRANFRNYTDGIALWCAVAKTKPLLSPPAMASVANGAWLQSKAPDSATALNVIPSLIVAYHFASAALDSVRSGEDEENVVQSILGSKVRTLLEAVGIHCVQPESAEQLANVPVHSGSGQIAILCSPALLKMIKPNSHGE